MPNDLAGFDFTIELSEGLATQIVDTVFAEAVETLFTHDQPGQPGVIHSRQTIGGQFVFQQYLIDIETGYEFNLFNPVVRFVGGALQLIEIAIDFGLKLPRNLVAFAYDTTAQSPLADDPSTVKPAGIYQEVYRTAPSADPFPGAAAPYHTGDITLRFPLVQKPFSSGRRVSAATGGVTRRSVVAIRLDEAFDPRLKQFLEAVASKALTQLIAHEIDDYDLTPLLGNLDAFGLKVRDPVVARIGTSGGRSSLGVAFNEAATVGNGDPTKIPFLLGGADFAVSIRESMLAQLILSLYQVNLIPHRYSLQGAANPHGDVLLDQPRISFVAAGLMIAVRLRVGNVLPGQVIIVNVAVTLRFDAAASGELHMTVRKLDVDIDVEGLGLVALINTVTFNLLGAIVGGILASILQKPISNSLDDGLQVFMNTGRLAFAFNAPIRGTTKAVAVKPTAFVFAPGICTLRGAVHIV